MLSEMILFICLLILIIGSYTDIRWREIPDWLTYAGIIAGVGIRAIESIITADFWPSLEGILGFAIAWGIACALFYLGQWGGGDAKAFMALGSLIGVRFSVGDFSVSFLMNLLIAGGFYGVAWCVVLATRNSRKTFKEFKALFDSRQMLYTSYVAAGLSVILGLAGFFSDDGSIFDGAFIGAYGGQRIFLYSLSAGILVFLGLLLFMKSVENACFFRRMKVAELTEGEWIVEDVKARGRLIASSKDLGVSLSQIKAMKQNGIKSVLVKIGIPFIPSFLLAFLGTYYFGNVLFIVVGMM